jgi:hypothetical protein
MTISLTASPFYLLGASLRDDRTKIAEAVERALEDGDIDEQAIIRAQQTLMAPKPGLAAELAWLPGIAPVRARQLVEAPCIEAEVLSGLPPWPQPTSPPIDAPAITGRTYGSDSQLPCRS